MEAQHVYCVCQPGAEPALKAEVAARAPAWRFAFSRPGFVTFKLPEPTAVVEWPRLVFARARGRSLGKVAGNASARALAEAVWRLPTVEQLQTQPKRRGLHVWQRETRLPGVNGVEPGATPLVGEVRSVLAATAPDEESVAPDPALGQLVLDVAIVEPNEWWVGCHVAATRVDRWSGGTPPIAPPDHAVSRAYLKMAEGLRWSALPTAGGDLWVELGCAPGGASQALLDAGMCVLGVDPAEVDPAVLEQENFAHLRGKTSDIRRKELNDARWLAADINAAPAYTLDAVESVVTHHAARFRGLLLTLKLPEWRLAAPDKLVQYVERVRGWGFRDVRMRQLAFNRREVCLAALRSRGQRRVKR